MNFLKNILTPIRFLGDHWGIFTPGFWRDPWTYGKFSPLTLPTIRYLALLKHVKCPLSINHSSSNSVSSYWSSMTYILEFLDTASLIQTSGSEAVLLTTVGNMSSNTTRFFGEIEPVERVYNQPNLCWMNFAEEHINPYLITGRPLRNFYSRILKIWFQNICWINPKTTVTSDFWHWLKYWPWPYLNII